MVPCARITAEGRAARHSRRLARATVGWSTVLLAGEVELRRRVRELLQAVEPPMAPVDAIIRRGRGIRLRRAATAAGGLGVVAIIAAATLLPSPATPAPQQPPLPVTVPASGIAGPDGVFASGIADGRPWRLAVQDIAGPGYRCVPAVTVNGTDADLLFPNPGD